jgi:hypothetical protein
LNEHLLVTERPVEMLPTLGHPSGHPGGLEVLKGVHESCLCQRVFIFMYTTIGFQLQPTAVAAAPNDKNRIDPNFVLSQMRHDTKNHYSCKHVGLGFKPNFFMCLVKPMPELD